MRAAFVVRNRLQLSMFRLIASSPYFQAVGGHAGWLLLDPGLGPAAPTGAAVLGEAEVLVGSLSGPGRLRRRRAALRRLQPLLERELDRLRPDVVVLANDRPFAEQAVVAAARRRGIPTLLVQDGFIPTWADLAWRDRFRLLAGHALWRSGLAAIGAPRPGAGVTDHAAVMGAHWRDLVRTRSGRPETVHVVGQPLFDETVRRAAEGALEPDGRNQVRALFLATDFLAGFSDRDAHRLQLADIRALHGVLAEVAGNGSPELVVRPHPLDAPADFAELESLPGVSIDAGGSLDDAVLAADVVVSNITSACLNAIAVRVPALLFTLHFHRGRYRRLVRMYPVETATSLAAARTVLGRLGHPFERAQWVAENSARASGHLYVDPDQSAGELIVFLLHEVARPRETVGAAASG